MSCMRTSPILDCHDIKLNEDGSTAHALGRSLFDETRNKSEHAMVRPPFTKGHYTHDRVTALKSELPSVLESQSGPTKPG